MGSDDASLDYESIRKHRLEENKKRMQELGISELSQSLSKAVHKTNSKPVKQREPKDDFPIEVRRSSRVMDAPRPNYSDAAFDFRLPRRSGPRIAGLPMRYASDVERIKAAERANKLQEELQNGNPSFVKLMLVSHVSGGFWLGLPLHFCKKNLPLNDGVVVLEDEKGGEWDSIYLAHRTGLSGGWRGFAMDHHLEDGDALIFELIQARRFKVHIVRISELASESENKENVVSCKGGQKRKSGEKIGKTKSGKKLVKKGKKSPREVVSEPESQTKAKSMQRSPLGAQKSATSNAAKDNNKPKASRRG
ncbi:hypothetical protein GOP47_0008319 [Adiantum capillus-veneris]|uniref:TF-B3 domain-containing protein n=1 Tax=Adiantum capillus-veneris TaxID=13818 RepID=A0A9D4ZI27_ADICA|nr:hypothetical protein GOP47_0008319 [Adiantum capillus-veneris]